MIIRTLGAVGIVVVLALLLGTLLLFIYMILHFGEKAVWMFLPYIKEMLKALRSEPRKAHPAIRLELRLTYFFAAVFALCFGAIVAHALVPWISKALEEEFFVVLLSSLILFSAFGGVSIKLALRLP